MLVTKQPERRLQVPATDLPSRAPRRQGRQRSRDQNATSAAARGRRGRGGQQVPGQPQVTLAQVAFGTCLDKVQGPASCPHSISPLQVA